MSVNLSELQNEIDQNRKERLDKKFGKFDLPNDNFKHKELEKDDYDLEKGAEPTLDNDKIERERVQNEEEISSEADEEGLDPFNLENERDEGDFDVDGNYTKSQRKSDDERDDWVDKLDRMNPQDSKKILRAKQKELETIKKEEQRCDTISTNKRSFYTLIYNTLLPKETPKTALCRLKKEKKISDLNALMDACCNLVDIGDFTIYQKTKESLSSNL
ncbi:hypothetical protein EIN_284720 [Entamoeba invadens IP1]|uniref:Uncharacterized protein n=1 Tax=Entamoeba invadens IP1 TaxID=370355 RepID=L7FJU5_ENTIV|nr:hypothetical protein EIN_284720 [Entamoeba invadens IP1]ELP84886.1 hypothetical protein EIN_284720 [Entamoeba invadens IP1]|eukprot:XP_004184232.1 hypothetical protein EIN_284720 [Entamoeba invadens IP1]